MKPIFITLTNKLPLMIIPDSQAHANGHAVLTYTYSVYRSVADDAKLVTDTESILSLEKKNNPGYMGYITFEQPGRMFTYTADGQQLLTSTEVEEVIELISHYRDSPQQWEI